MKRWRWCFVACVLLLPSLAWGDYIAYSLKRMVRVTELVVEGSIVKVEAKVFHIKVRQQWGKAGQKKLTTIPVLRFRNWPCAVRRPYKVGQKGFFFLIRSKGKWRTIGAGNEGELAIKKQKAHWRGSMYRSALKKRAFVPSVFRQALTDVYVCKKGCSTKKKTALQQRSVLHSVLLP